MRSRPLLTTTVDPDLYARLLQEQSRVPRPLSFVLDEALRVWSTSLTETAEEHQVDRVSA